uniref:RING-CH-type domain-containing protein n=1 Tax=Brassica oleracea var. oleracea TaxID=109376 RepID=A0A0D3A2I9_BRAOL
MDVFPAENEDGGYDRALPAEESDKDDDDDGGDLCRICRSPEGPNDPLRYPCACRGSIKYVHQECLRL